jgi:hypothetical protein
LGDSLMPGPSDAAWIAQFGARRLMAHLRDGDGARKALRATLADTQKSFEALRRHEPEEMWQTPCASMMLAAAADSGVEFLLVWGLRGLVKQGDAPAAVIGETFDKRAAEARRAQTLAKEKNVSPASGLSRAEFIADLRASRNRINSGNNWLFSPDVKAAAHVSRRVMKVTAWQQHAVAHRRFSGAGQRLWRLQRRQLDGRGDEQRPGDFGRATALDRVRRQRRRQISAIQEVGRCDGPIVAPDLVAKPLARLSHDFRDFFPTVPNHRKRDIDHDGRPI